MRRWRQSCSPTAGTAGSRCSSWQGRSPRGSGSAHAFAGRVHAASNSGRTGRLGVRVRAARRLRVRGHLRAKAARVGRSRRPAAPPLGAVWLDTRVELPADAPTVISRCRSPARRSKPDAAGSAHNPRGGDAVRTASRSRCWLLRNAIPHDHRRRLHRLADPGGALCAAHSLSRRGADRSAQRPFHARPRVDLQYRRSIRTTRSTF